jgi:hypothetical protein
MKNSLLSLAAALLLWAPLTHAQLVDNDEGLFELAARDTRGVQTAAIHADNLADLQRFISFDVLSMNTDRGVDAAKPKFLHTADAAEALRTVEANPVVSLYSYNKYDPRNEGIGFCFGRAMFIHLELLQRGLDRRAVQKAFVVGHMQTPDGGQWGWHVTTIAQSKNAQGKEIWLAIDPIVGRVIEVSEWYKLMRDSYSTDKKLKLYITHGTRFGPRGVYDEEQIRNAFYNNYFTDMMKWFDKESRAGRYKTPLRKI